MAVKERTWPYAVVPDKVWPGMAAVRKLNGDVLDMPPMSKGDARRFCDALNEAFDWGRDAED